MIEESTTLQVGWVYKDGKDHKWIVYEKREVNGHFISEYPFTACCIDKQESDSFSENGIYDLKRITSLRNLILSTGMKLDL